MSEAAARSGASMSRHCLAGPTRKEEELIERMLPRVYLTAKGAGLPRKMEPMEESAESERRPPG
jgi:hypothetical protein|tara:strand:- start:337 stop:528 length:192 start_codon:yes stop_codon:yes gene_type:complete